MQSFVAEKTLPCTKQDYVTLIYAGRTKLPPAMQYSCAFQTNGTVLAHGNCCTNATSLKSDRDFVYQEQESYAAYLANVHRFDPIMERKNSIIIGNANPAKSVEPKCAIEPACAGSIRPDLFTNPDVFKEPAKTLPGRRFATQTPFRPASSLPILDRYDWSPVVEEQYCFESEEDALAAFNGIHNGLQTRRTKFNRTSFQEQVDEWNRLLGVADADLNTIQSSCPSRKNLIKCKPRLQNCSVTPVPYNFTFTDFK